MKRIANSSGDKWHSGIVYMNKFKKNIFYFFKSSHMQCYHIVKIVLRVDYSLLTLT